MSEASPRLDEEQRYATPPGVAGAPRAPAAGAHSFIAIFRGFALAHPRLSSQRLPGAPGLISKKNIEGCTW